MSALAFTAEDYPPTLVVGFFMGNYFLSTEVHVIGLSDEEKLRFAQKLSDELTASLTPLWIGNISFGFSELLFIKKYRLTLL